MNASKKKSKRKRGLTVVLERKRRVLGSSIDWRLGPHGPFIGQVTLLPRRGRWGALGQTGDGGCVTKGTVETGGTVEGGKEGE